MGFPQALWETRAIQAEIPTNLVGNLSYSLCWKAFPQPLSEGYTIHNLAVGGFLTGKNTYLANLAFRKSICKFH
jgi:hypothetical protein